MTNKDKCVLSYFAGLLDGEGYIGLTRQKPKTNRWELGHWNYRPIVLIMMNDAIGLLFLKHLFPEFQIHYRPAYGRRNRPYELKIDGIKCYDFLKKIKPFVIVKHEQVAILASYIAWKRKYIAKIKNTALLGYDEEYWKVSEKFYNLLREKKKPYNGVNSVKLLEQMSLRQYRAKLADVEKLREGVTTMVRQLNEKEANKPISAPEQDIV